MRRGLLAIAALMMLGALAGESAAQRLTKNALMGRWCTDGGSYYFTPDSLTVTLANGGRRVLHISSIEVNGPSIVVGFSEDSDVASRAHRGRGSYTTFSQFVGDVMIQVPDKRDDGKGTPIRLFQRC